MGAGKTDLDAGAILLCASAATSITVKYVATRSHPGTICSKCGLAVSASMVYGRVASCEYSQDARHCSGK